MSILLKRSRCVIRELKKKEGDENMIFLWIGFIWLMVALGYFGFRHFKEKKARLQISKEGMKKYQGIHCKKNAKGMYKW